MGQSMTGLALYLADVRALNWLIIGGVLGADSIGLYNYRMITGRRGQRAKDLEIGATVRMLGPGVLLYELAWVVDFLFVYSRNLID